MDKILVVDDNFIDRTLLAMVLKKAGFQVTEADSGPAALEQAATFLPDLVLLDILMPEMDGYQVCAHLKKDAKNREIPVIFLSGLSETTDKVKGFEIGGVDYLTKPCDREEVLARVRSHLKIRALTQQLLEANRELLEKQRRLDEDLKAAALIQSSLLPTHPPNFPNISIFWRFQPCDQIGGDIFNVFQLDEQHLGIYMMDVCGHGIPGAMVTVSVSQILQPEIGYLKRNRSDYPFYELLSPAEVCFALDHDYPIDRFDKHFTIVYAILDTFNGGLKYCGAAHPSPLLFHADGRVELLDKKGTLIGLGEFVPFKDGEKQLETGDRLIFYTDGVVECRNEKGEFFGEDRFLALLREQIRSPLEALINTVFDSLAAFVGKPGFEDDVSLLGVEFKGARFGKVAGSG